MEDILFIIIICAVIIGIPLLIVNHYRKQRGIGWNDGPLFAEKTYESEEEKQKDLKKSYRLAKRTIILFRIFIITLIVLFLAAALLLITAMLDEFILKNDLLFYYFDCLIPLLIFLFTGIWYAIAGKRLEITMIYLGKDTSQFETLENEAAAANLKNAVGRAAGHPEVALEDAGLITQMYEIALDYLKCENQKTPSKIITNGILAVCVAALFLPLFTLISDKQIQDAHIEAVAQMNEELQTIYQDYETGEISYSAKTFDDSFDIRKISDDKEEASLSLCVDDNGSVTEITFSYYIDPDRSPEENMANANSDFEEMASLYINSDLDFTNAAIKNITAFPEDFTTAFINGRYNEEIREKMDTQEGYTYFVCFNPKLTSYYHGGEYQYVFITVE